MPRPHALLVVLVLGLAAAARPAAADVTRDHVPAAEQALYRDFPVVELVTMGIGSLIWERHGHIALCVRYQDPSQDACYNYGIGDFADPVKMGWGFFRGANSFWVGKMDPQQMLGLYQYFDRSIWVQPLPLTAAQKQQVIAKLEDDILDAHRYYAYDHFEDNCTTRVRNVIDDATDHALKNMTATVDDRTIRDLAREGFFGMRIPLLITDLAMGRSTDHVPTYWERMFLPQYMREAVQLKWGIEPIVLYARKGPPQATDGPSGRVLFALLGLLMALPAILGRRFGKLRRTGLVVTLLPQFLLGSAFWFLAIISPLPYVHWNETCLVFLPLDLIGLLMLPERLRVRYAQGRVVMLALVVALLLIGVLRQPLLAAVVWPLVPAAVVGFWPASWSRR
jgi:hypothetical protein